MRSVWRNTLQNINYLNTMELRSYAYGCELTPIPTHNIELCAAKKDWDLDRTNPIAIYDNENKTINVYGLWNNNKLEKRMTKDAANKEEGEIQGGDELARMQEQIDALKDF